MLRRLVVVERDPGARRDARGDLAGVRRAAGSCARRDRRSIAGAGGDRTRGLRAGGLRAGGWRFLRCNLAGTAARDASACTG